MFDAWLALCGGISLFLSLAFGVVTYHESKLILGPTEDYLEELTYRPDRVDEEWETDLVDSYGAFVESNAEDIEFSGDLLLGQQVFLIEGVLLFGLAILL